jgi:hypothetical protein
VSECVREMKEREKERERERKRERELVNVLDLCGFVNVRACVHVCVQTLNHEISSQGVSLTAEDLKLKCHLADDVRVVVVSRAITFKDMHEAIADEFCTDVRIKYKDEEGDLVTISSDKSLALALPLFPPPPQVVHLYISPAGQGPVVAMQSENSFLRLPSGDKANAAPTVVKKVKTG